MKVTIFTSAHPADDKRVFQRHAKYLAEKGWDVVLVAPGLEGERRDAGVRVIGIGPRLGYGGRLRRLRTMFRVVAGTDADIYHFHDPDLLPVGAWLKQRTGRPVIYDSHENYRLAALSSRGFPPLLAPLVATGVDRVEKLLARQCSAVVSPHPARLRELVDGTRGVRSLSVPNVPRRSYGDSVTEHAKADPPEVIYIGILSPERGEAAVLAAAAELPDVTFRLLVDMGSPERREAYQQEAIDAGLRNVLVQGYVPYDELPRVLSRASVGIMPWQATPQHIHAAQPTKLFEYMAMGLPIVASDLPITREIVEASGAGVLHAPDNGVELANRIRELLADSDRLEALGRAGRESFLLNYSYDAVGDRLMDLYRDLCASHADPSLGRMA